MNFGKNFFYLLALDGFAFIWSKVFLRLSWIYFNSKELTFQYWCDFGLVVKYSGNEKSETSAVCIGENTDIVKLCCIIEKVINSNQL